MPSATGANATRRMEGRSRGRNIGAGVLTAPATKNPPAPLPGAVVSVPWSLCGGGPTGACPRSWPVLRFAGGRGPTHLTIEIPLQRDAHAHARPFPLRGRDLHGAAKPADLLLHAEEAEAAAA